LKEHQQELGVFELDESYFGAKRVRGKRGRGAAGKTPEFGLRKRGGKVFVTIVSHCSKETLMPIIQGRILTGSTIHTDGWKV
jgi:transposase-like protein